MKIDKDKLKALAEDPNNDVKAICAGLGISDPTLYQHMGRDPELKQIFKEARATAKAVCKAGAGDGEGKVSAKAKRRKSAKKAVKRLAPRKGHANGGMSSELLRRIKHEFEHIALYESFTDHFEELQQEVNAIQS